jgi:hypothetical protein
MIQTLELPLLLDAQVCSLLILQVFFFVGINTFYLSYKELTFERSATKGLVQQRFCEIAKYVVNSNLSFARNFILAEKSRLRSSQPRKAAKR